MVLKDALQNGCISDNSESLILRLRVHLSKSLIIGVQNMYSFACPFVFCHVSITLFFGTSPRIVMSNGHAFWAIGNLFSPLFSFFVVWNCSFNNRFLLKMLISIIWLINAFGRWRFTFRLSIRHLTQWGNFHFSAYFGELHITANSKYILIRW